MKIKVSNYIADQLAENGIKAMFTVTGGGAMHLNDAFGHHAQLKCTYHHHEQAAAMAAEAYARVDNEMAAVCVTTGPGATNAITGALCAWMDSIPMLVISGQVRYDTTVRSTGLSIRTMGVQEYDIEQSVKPMTKYAVMVTDPMEIRYHLEKALYLARSGRPGPCWLDIPLNVQSAMIETDDLKGYDRTEDLQEVPPEIPDLIVEHILDKISGAKRPIVFAGHGIRIAGAYDRFRRLVDLMGVPVVTGMSSIDLIPSDHPLYAGRNGGTGNRAGNFAVQNSDVFLSLGSRQSFLQTGFNFQKWAREAYTILNDIDGEELKKPSLHVDVPVVGDVAELIEKLIEKLQMRGCSTQKPLFGEHEMQRAWVDKCRALVLRYPVVTELHYKTVEEGRSNTYAFYDALSQAMEEDSQILVSVGTSRVAGSQAFQIKENQRFYTNAVTASMGYGLPAAIGICIGSGRKKLVMVCGEGCLQMNIQEFQTIVHNRLPIYVFVVNNEGYHSIRQTQTAYFNGPLIGIGEESGDLSFPDLSKLVPAYNMPYHAVTSSEGLKEQLQMILNSEAPCVTEVFVTKQQKTEPKLASRQLADGTMVSASLEDMYPFLSREEMNEIMEIAFE